MDKFKDSAQSKEENGIGEVDPRAEIKEQAGLEKRKHRIQSKEQTDIAEVKAPNTWESGK